MGSRPLWAWICTASLIACVDVAEESSAGTVSFSDDASQGVYELLLRDCGFVTCHGDSGRFFRVVGPGRVRLAPDTEIFAEATSAEMALTFERLREQMDPAEPLNSPVLRKPLAKEVGGAGHRGLDVYGRDVYLTEADSRYQLLRDFVLTYADDTEEVLP